jgi:hypothetical protein
MPGKRAVRRYLDRLFPLVIRTSRGKRCEVCGREAAYEVLEEVATVVIRGEVWDEVEVRKAVCTGCALGWAGAVLGPQR